MLANSEIADGWLSDFKREVDEKKLWMLRDRPGYFEFLNQVPANIANHMPSEPRSRE